MRNYIFLVIAILTMTSCDKEVVTPVEINTYDAIIGKWEKISKLSPYGYFMPERDGSYYEFKTDWTFCKSTTEIRRGSFQYDPATRTVRCNFSANDFEMITITFIDSQNAELNIVGSEKIKVIRSTGS